MISIAAIFDGGWMIWDSRPHEYILLYGYDLASRQIHLYRHNPYDTPYPLFHYTQFSLFYLKQRFKPRLCQNNS